MCISVVVPSPEPGLIAIANLDRKGVKSKICTSVLQGKECVHKTRCYYAHSTEELAIEVIESLFKKSRCKAQGDCKYKLACNFLHNDDEVTPYVHPKLKVSCSAVKKDGVIYRLFLERPELTPQEAQVPVFPFRQPMVVHVDLNATAAQTGASAPPKPNLHTCAKKTSTPSDECKAQADRKKFASETMSKQ